MIAPQCSDEVKRALATGSPVVAMESTIYSNLGLPAPANAEALDRCIAAVRNGGAVPAVTAILDGVVRVGLDPNENDRILGGARKAAERDIPVAVAQQWDFRCNYRVRLGVDSSCSWHCGYLRPAASGECIVELN